MQTALKKFHVLGLIVAMGLVQNVWADVLTDDQREEQVILEQPKPAEFTRMDQPFVIFKTWGKYKGVTIVDPRKGQFDTVLCGAQDPVTGEIKAAKKVEDLAYLRPLRHMMKSADWGKKMDKVYPGYREALTALLLESFLQTIGLMSQEEYKGSILIDEYNKCFPMKWVLNNAEEVKALRAYFEGNVTPCDAHKPLLVLTLLDEKSTIDSSDQAFLDRHFKVVRDDDASVVEFFGKGSEIIKNIVEATKGAEYMMEDFGQSLLRQLESSTEKFKAKELAIKATKYVALAATTGLVIKLFNKYYDRFVGWVDKRVGSAPNDIRNVLHLSKNVDNVRTA